MVLKQLFENHERDIETRIYKGREYFHPKVYLMENSEGLLKCFIDSANTTQGGLNGNIELSIAVEDQDKCRTILQWFEEHYKHGGNLSEAFLEKYLKISKNMKRRDSSNHADTVNLRSLLNSNHAESSAIISDQQFFNTLHYQAYAYENELDYSASANERRRVVWQRFKELHGRMYPLFTSYGLAELHKHSNPPNLISHAQYKPGFNNAHLRAMWLHYGYLKTEYADSFLSHPRIQVIIHHNDIGIWLVVGTERGSIKERLGFKTKLHQDEHFREYVAQSITELGDAYEIHMSGQSRSIAGFASVDALMSFLMNDEPGSYFIIRRTYSPQDPDLSEANIAQNILLEFIRLYTLYKTFKSFR